MQQRVVEVASNDTEMYLIFEQWLPLARDVYHLNLLASDSTISPLLIKFHFPSNVITWIT